MDVCNLKWIFILFCLFIACIGLYLAFLREHRNIKGGALDPQDGSGSIKEGSISFKFAIGLVLIIIGVLGGYFSIKYLPGCDQGDPGDSRIEKSSDTKDSVSDKNLNPVADSIKEVTAKKDSITQKLDTTTVKKPEGKQRLTVWSYDEIITKGKKAATKYLFRSINEIETVVRILGVIEYPIVKSDVDSEFEEYIPAPDYAITFKVYINGITKDSWDIRLFDGDQAIYRRYRVNKTINFGQTNSDNLQIELYFKPSQSYKEGEDYKQAIIKKGFKISIKN